jgi:hypothetical protein
MRNRRIARRLANAAASDEHVKRSGIWRNQTAEKSHYDELGFNPAFPHVLVEATELVQPHLGPAATPGFIVPAY